MKKALLTVATPEIASLCQPFLENHRLYAEARGYDYLQTSEKFWPDLHPSFTKVHVIREAMLAGYKEIVWADADVAFMDFRVDLADLLKKDIFMAGYHQANWKLWKYICAGLTVWKRTADAMDFVDEWHERCTIGTLRIEPKKRVIVTYPPWEQWYMDEIIRETAFKGIYAASAEEIGCFCPEMWHDGILWRKGMPTIHFAGQHTWERRVEVFEQIYKPLIVT